jgi:hypothetical protein
MNQLARIFRRNRMNDEFLLIKSSKIQFKSEEPEGVTLKVSKCQSYD